MFNKVYKTINNVSITYKVGAISAVAIFCFFSFLIFQYFSTSAINSRLLEIETEDMPVLNILDENFVSFISARTSLIAASVEQDLDELESAKVEVGKIESGLVEIKRLRPELREDTDILIMNIKQYINIGLSLAEGLSAEDVDFEQIQMLTERLKESEKHFLDRHDSFLEARTNEFVGKLTSSRASGDAAAYKGGVAAIIVAFILIAISVVFIRMINSALHNAIDTAEKIAEGDRDSEVTINSTDETGQLLSAISKMRDGLLIKEQAENIRQQEQEDLAGLNDTLRGEHDMVNLGDRILNYLAPILNAQVAALYIFENDKLKMVSSYAFTRRKNFSSEFEVGEYLIGQAALERKQIVVEDIPQDYISVGSALGNSSPNCIVVTPIINDTELEAVLEVGSVSHFTDAHLAFLNKIAPMLAVGINSTQSRKRLSEMLNVTKEQAEKLRASEASLQEQQEELRVSNEELEQQAVSLKKSEEHLQNQQEELRVINEELEEQTKALEVQQVVLEKNNNELEESRKDLEQKSEDLAKSSQYKSEFLSTMSHELRTPLNSILILSKILSDNKTENLTQKQVGHVEVIHSAGSDLLELINDILDLSKIEEGKLDFVVDNINLSTWTEKLNKNFNHVVADKGLDFRIILDESLDAFMLSDEHRINQVVKNMISNALKFTEHGGITIKVARPEESKRFKDLGLKAEDSVAFSVIDTGIGIPAEKQDLIFEAFQQADGTTSRKFGGTGLGLTISKQLSMFLGGDLLLSSEGEGKGSTFSLVIPVRAQEALDMPKALLEEITEGAAAESANLSVVSDAKKAPEQDELEKLPNTLLIIEDDDVFASTLSELASEYGLNIIRTPDGESALELLKEKQPSAIILDVGLPGIDGWEVMDRLKEDPRTADIPVHFMSGHDSEDKAMEMGAIDFLMKPVSADQLSQAFKHIEEEALAGVKRLLVIEDNEVELLSIEEMFADKDIVMTTVSTGQGALDALEKGKFDCMIMDLDLPDINGLALMEQLDKAEDFDPIPVIVYTAKDLSREEEGMLRRYASRIILKAGESSDRLISEVSLFLHWLENKNENKPVLPAEGRDDIFNDKRVLAVDDDMRNIYSLSAVLEGVGLECELASNGIECLEVLKNDQGFDAILMDIMMPEMDGYEAMGEIRKQEQFKNIPIIALTAKAMKEDKQKCIDAGASDYITKPLDNDKLLALLRVWLSQNDQQAKAS